MTKTENTSEAEDSKYDEAGISKYNLIMEVLFQFTENWKHLLKMSETVESIWVSSLSDLSEDEIRTARDRCLRELKYPPKPKEFLDRTSEKIKSAEVRNIDRTESDRSAAKTLKELNDYAKRMSIHSDDEDLPQRPPKSMQGIPMPPHVRAKFRELFAKTAL